MRSEKPLTTPPATLGHSRLICISRNNREPCPPLVHLIHMSQSSNNMASSYTILSPLDANATTQTANVDLGFWNDLEIVIKAT